MATLIGLAFRIKDPDHLLGDKEDLGISCALIAHDLDGVEIGQRHDPMGVPFMNGPIVGKDVFARSTASSAAMPASATAGAC